MALPKLLQKLFQNGGAGEKLNESIMPFAYAKSVNGKLPDSSGNIEIPARNVGDEWHSFTGQIPSGGVPYCGQEVTRATYADLWAWVQAQGLVKTESEWQALATSQNGNVPFYSDGDGSTTFRMPKVVGYIKGAASQSAAGGYTAEGLPNITGTIGLFGVYAFGEITNVGALDADTLATGLASLEAKAVAWNPVATVVAFAANSAPTGYLLCNGAAVARTTYAALFAVIGTTYGAGDGSTTFNLPNLTDKFIQGSGTAGTVKSAGLPNIYGATSVSILRGGGAGGESSGLITFSSGSSAKLRTGGNSYISGSYLTFNAAKANAIYGNGSTVQPPSLTMRYYIKY